MSDKIEIVQLPPKEALSKILGAAKAWYIPEVEAHLIRNRGLFFSNRESYSHKWKENGKNFDFCLKCGVSKEIEKYYNHGCPVSAKQYNSYPFSRHTYESIEIKSGGRPIWRPGKGYIRPDPMLYRFEVCRKCGIIESREKIFYKIDKDTGGAYEVKSPVGAKKAHIHCSLTDDEYDVRDIII